MFSLPFLKAYLDKREYYQYNTQHLAEFSLYFARCGLYQLLCGIFKPLIKSRINPYSNLANTLTLLQQFYLLPFYSIFKSIFKETLPKEWNSKKVFGDIEGYDEKFYWPSIQYSLSKQEQNHLIKFSNINDQENNFNFDGIKYGRLRTSDGQYVSSHWIKRKSKRSRNNYCVQIRRIIDKVAHRPSAPSQLIIMDIYGIVEYFFVHKFND
ncbi:unnamed protein product [Rhizophagus irregularis]|nr:unnamed protein product [Rhizophagus irregularis]